MFLQFRTSLRLGVYENMSNSRTIHRGCPKSNCEHIILILSRNMKMFRPRLIMEQLRGNQLKFWDFLDLFQVSLNVLNLICTCLTVNPCKESPGLSDDPTVA